MKVASRLFADVLVVEVTGRLDHDTSRDFGDQLKRLSELPGRVVRTVVLDLAGLDYISSSGLKRLMAVSKDARALGQRILVAALQPMVIQMFETSHLHLLLQIFPTVGEAIAMASREAAAVYNAGSA